MAVITLSESTDTVTTALFGLSYASLYDIDYQGSSITSITLSTASYLYDFDGVFDASGTSGTITDITISNRFGSGDLIDISNINLSLDQLNNTSDAGIWSFATGAYSGADQAFGSSAADEIHTYGGNDTIYGGGSLVATLDGNDTIYAGGGADSIFGNAGDDFLVGGEDYLDFDDAADSIHGGLGNDLLVGAGGNDTLGGGAGNDIFVLAQNSGTDTIIDFTSGQDVISIQGTSYEILGTDGIHSFLQTDTGTGVLLLWTTPDELSATDFYYWS